jgi:C-terminal processing protease CtpA/Prc
MRESNFLFTKVEVLPGNIGYVQFNGFTGFLREARPTFTGAFRFVANTKALIIDMRMNGGGSPAMVCHVASYFFPTKRHWNDIVYRHRTGEFWTDPAEADSLTLSMPVYILTSKRTFSGAEDFSYGMQSLRRAIIVGDTTGGGAHPTRPIGVGLGFVADIPFARSLNPYTHTDWEGTGVIPDIPVVSGKALESAERAILMVQLKDAKTELETRQAQWQLNRLVAMQGTERLDASFLASLTGMYQGGLDFYVQGHELYCKNRERGNAVFQLQYIDSSRFVLDENVQVEFTKDDKGRFSGINMWWIDGRVSHKPKEK